MVDSDIVSTVSSMDDNGMLVLESRVIGSLLEYLVVVDAGHVEDDVGA